MRPQTIRTLLAALVAAVVAACGSPSPGSGLGPAHLAFGDDRLELTVTACTLVAGRLLEEVPAGGSEVTVVAEGQDTAGEPVRVTARRGTDEVAPHRFELLEISRGAVTEGLEVVVLLRGYDRVRDTWTQVDPDAPGARRNVREGLFEIDGARLVSRAASAYAPDGTEVTVAFEAVCPPELERDAGLA